MNKVILMGRLVKDVELRYSPTDEPKEPVIIGKYTLAVTRPYKRDGETADFINLVAFGKAAEFAERYFKKGQKVCVVGRLQIRNYEDKEGKKQYYTEVIVEEQYFAEGKKDS